MGGAHRGCWRLRAEQEPCASSPRPTHTALEAQHEGIRSLSTLKVIARTATPKPRSTSEQADRNLPPTTLVTRQERLTRFQEETLGISLSINTGSLIFNQTLQDICLKSKEKKTIHLLIHH